MLIQITCSDASARATSCVGILIEHRRIAAERDFRQPVAFSSPLTQERLLRCRNATVMASAPIRAHGPPMRKLDARESGSPRQAALPENGANI
jgi:hypothetical protein